MIIKSKKPYTQSVPPVIRRFAARHGLTADQERRLLRACLRAFWLSNDRSIDGNRDTRAELESVGFVIRADDDSSFGKSLEIFKRLL